MFSITGKAYPMRTLSYLILLPLAWFTSDYAFSWLAYPLSSLVSYGQLTYLIIFFSTFITQTIKALIVFRVIFWIKNRSIAAPEQYSDWAFLLGAIISIFILLTIGGYTYLINSKTHGVSGIPLAIALGISGLLSMIPIFIVELRSLYSLIPTTVKPIPQ